MSIDAVIFYMAAVVAVAGGTMMIFQRNPVMSVLYLIVSLVAQAVLYVQLNALFLGAVLIIVYSGAILVLFLFVIMLLNLRGTEDLGEDSQPISRFAKYFLAILFAMELILAVTSGVRRVEPQLGIMNMAASDFGSAKAVATLLFTEYLYPFELTGVLLLAAIVGAVVIARREREDELPLENEETNKATKAKQEVDR